MHLLHVLIHAGIKSIHVSKMDFCHEYNCILLWSGHCLIIAFQIQEISTVFLFTRIIEVADPGCITLYISV